MKRAFIIAGMVGLMFAIAGDAQAQNRRRTTPKKRTTTAVNAAAQPAVVAPLPPPPPVDTIPIRVVKQGRRPSTTIDSGGVTILDKIPLKHDNIRLDDQVYRQVVWRVIDTREKMNMGFSYEADEDNGNQKFLNIILKHIKEGNVGAFSAADDRFTTLLSTAEVAKMLAGSSYEIDVPDFVNDPSGATMKTVTVRNEFNEASIRQFALKEEIIFDRETSRLHFRILGIAPMQTIFNDDGSERATTRLFWVYYPDLRPLLSRYDAYNPRNMGARMSWEEIFESRYFSSYIYKSTLNNPFDRPLDGIVKDPLMRLLEGDKIKNTIFNWEQDQWSY